MKALDGARNAMESVKKRIDVLTENKRQKRTTRRKK